MQNTSRAYLCVGAQKEKPCMLARHGSPCFQARFGEPGLDALHDFEAVEYDADCCIPGRIDFVAFLFSIKSISSKTALTRLRIEAVFIDNVTDGSTKKRQQELGCNAPRTGWVIASELRGLAVYFAKTSLMLVAAFADQHRGEKMLVAYLE